MILKGYFMFDFSALHTRCDKAFARKDTWVSLWRECYAFAFPQREGLFSSGLSKVDALFDATAADAVDQLASSLLSELTPPWARWFGLGCGSDIPSDRYQEAAQVLEKATDTLQKHFDHSNFSIEMHQCYLDLVVAGTACLLFEHAPAGELSAFKFTAVPLSELALEEGISGRLDTLFRRTALPLEALLSRFKGIELPEDILREVTRDPQKPLPILEMLEPRPTGGFQYVAFLDTEPFVLLKETVFETSPFIAFRWLKAPGETYGRSPVMKSLPDIKTANKVVELVLKNASIAVTGIWQAEDDGVLNPANIRLVPGAIIPKAMGSKGLTPLEPAGNFDVSQLMLSDLRARIRHALLVDKLGQIERVSMTATEVLERSAEMGRILGATYGRLQSELLTPLIIRAVSILRHRGEIPDISLDGRTVVLQYQSPLARQQAKQDVMNTMTWLSTVSGLDAEAALSAIDFAAATRWLAKALNIPPELVRMEEIPDV